MAVTAALVKELRERTGLGMMDCKKALVESNGDIEQAIENLRKKGQAKASKKAGRVAAEGKILVKIADNGKTAIMLEVNTETDFAAKDKHFNDFVNLVALQALDKQIGDITALKALPFSPESDANIETVKQTLVAKIGENIDIRRLIKINSNHLLGHYTHGGKIGVITELKGGEKGGEFELAKDIAMHVAAIAPEFVDPSQITDARKDKEREIFSAQSSASGKPPEIVKKMVDGRMRKFFAEISLTEQAFVKNPDIKVGQLLTGKGAEILSFIRFEVGEGIDKKEGNFAEEVAAMTRGEG